LIALGREKDSDYSIETVRRMPRGELLPRMVKMVGVYGKLLGCCDKEEEEEEEKGEEEKKKKRFLGNLDDAIGVMERLVI
jgi:hypothetical protein